MELPVFFWISGFLIARNYSDRIKDYSMYSFLRKRLKRLYPITFMSVTIGVLVSALDNVLIGQRATALIETKMLLVNYLLIQNNWFFKTSYTAYGSGTWYISVLLFCYIYYYLTNKIKNIDIRILVWLILMFMGFLNVEIPVMWHSGGICSFFGGVLLYELLYGRQYRITNPDIANSTKLFVVRALLLIMAVTIAYYGITYDIMILFASPIIILGAMEAPLFKKIMGLKPIQHEFCNDLY